MSNTLASTTTTQHLLNTGLMLSVMLLSACNSGSKETAAPLFTADPAAFEYAIAKTAEMQIFVRGCGSYDSDMKIKAEAAQAAWAARNWPQAEAADTHYSQALANESLVYNGEKIALAAVDLYSNIEKSVELKLDQSRHSRKNISDTCMNKLAAYESGQLDLSVGDKNADLYLKSLVSATPSKIHKVPTLAGTLQLSAIPGRSQYNLEKTLTEWSCLSARILTLRNEWPHESYGAFCASGKSIFVSCEWGECKTQ